LKAMAGRIFLAGAGGVVGRRLSLLLRDAGYDVYGSTRKQDAAAWLKATGITPVVVDVFDAPALSAALLGVGPEIVMHQLTDLSFGFDADRVDETLRRNARIRTEGTRNLVAAATAAGARRLVAQSIAWAYAPGPMPHREDDPLDKGATGARAVTVDGVRVLEELTLNAPPLDGIVLRYGRFYGPGTGFDRPSGADTPYVHVDAAAHAALLAAGKAGRGIFNIAEPGAYVSSEKAQREFGWDPGFRLGSD
jgi:nucleoside-diphosphate-sugar epimerase